MASSVRVVGLGGSLREGSTSLTALHTALAGATAAGAQSSIVRIGDLDLPMYTPQQATPAAARGFAGIVYGGGAMVWSTPTYRDSVSGSFKNALDWLILLAGRDPPYLTNKPIGQVSTVGGVRGNAAAGRVAFRGPSHCNAGLRHEHHRALNRNGRSRAGRTRQFQGDGTCDYATEVQFSPGEFGPPAATAAGRP